MFILGWRFNVRKRQKIAPDIKKSSKDKEKGLWACSESWYKQIGSWIPYVKNGTQGFACSQAGTTSVDLESKLLQRQLGDLLPD